MGELGLLQNSSCAELAASSVGDSTGICVINQRAIRLCRSLTHWSGVQFTNPCLLIVSIVAKVIFTAIVTTATKKISEQISKTHRFSSGTSMTNLSPYFCVVIPVQCNVV